MKEFNKKYIPLLLEQEIANLWKEENFVLSNKADVLLTSLPLPTAIPLHLGHAENLLVQDVFVRYSHLLGKQTQSLPLRYYGSFLTNEKIHQQLKKIGTSKEKISKAQFWDLVNRQLKKQKTHNSTQIKKLWLSLEGWEEHITFSTDFSRFLRTLFSDLVQNDTIYESEDIVYWNTAFQTSLSKDEVEFKKQEGKKYTIKYFISTKNNSVNVCTIAPETLFGDVALAVHPDNKKYHALVGQKAIIPIINKTIPIIADERVPLFDIIRITPAHDLFSLQIAKDHDLPLDHFAIDQEWCFTKFAGDFVGKKVDEFMQNILQNLDDIDNMVSVEDCTLEIPICKKTGEKLQVMCLVQWFLNIAQAKEKLTQSLESWAIKIFPMQHVDKITQHLETIGNRCISKNYLFGQNLPIRVSEKKWMIYILNESDVLDAYKRDNKKGKVFLSLIIFNLIADGRLNTTFEMEDLITVLLSHDLASDKSILHTYSDIIDKDIAVYAPQIKEIKELMQYVQSKGKSSNLEEFASLFIKLLDTSFAIEHVANHKYKFLIDSLVQRDSGLKQENSKFDIAFVNAVEVMYSLWLFDEKKGKKTQETLMTVGENVLLETCKVILLSLQLKDKIPCDTLFVNKTVCDHKQQKMWTLCQNNVDPALLIKTFGADTTRLYLLAQLDETINFDLAQVQSYNDLLHKFWNACRYVSIKNQESYGNKKINLATIEKEIEKWKPSLQEFDLWILNKTKNLYEEIDACISTNAIPEFGAKVLQIIKNDFCEKYLEISKTSTSPFTDKIMLLVISKLLTLLWIYAPFITEKIWILMWFPWYLSQQTLKENFLESIDKNYKIQLFMDIVDKFLSLKEQLGCKKHTDVDVFIQANPDFLRFTKSNENTIKHIIHINKIEYIHTNETYVSGYTTADIIDMTIGVKIAQAVEIIEKPKWVLELKKDLVSMEEYLQYLKNTVSSMMTNKSDEELIAQKKKEITKIKKSILELEYEISKMKVK